MHVKAYGKVNLALDVVKKRDDGYHELDMIMAPISLYNEIEIEQAPVDQIDCDSVSLPENSTIHKTLAVLRKHFSIQGYYRIYVKKHIPDQAGLAGSSADAAACLKAILDIEGISVEDNDLLEIGKEIGADVPFCIVGKWARVQGIGEKITLIDTDWKIPCQLIKPPFGISTPRAFALWSQTASERVNVDRIQRCIELKDYRGLMESMQNALEKPAFAIEPKLYELYENMNELGFDGVRMTGSGSTMMGFTNKEKVIEEKDCFTAFVTIG